MTDIEKAISLLKQNGYWVIKDTERMKMDMDRCVEMDKRGESMDCAGCACNICLLNLEG